MVLGFGCYSVGVVIICFSSDLLVLLISNRHNARGVLPVFASYEAKRRVPFTRYGMQAKIAPAWLHAEGVTQKGFKRRGLMPH